MSGNAKQRRAARRARARSWWGIDRSFGPPAQLTTVDIGGVTLITHVNGAPLLEALDGAFGSPEAVR